MGLLTSKDLKRKLHLNNNESACLEESLGVRHLTLYSVLEDKTWGGQFIISPKVVLTDETYQLLGERWHKSLEGIGDCHASRF